MKKNQVRKNAKLPPINNQSPPIDSPDPDQLLKRHRLINKLHAAGDRKVWLITGQAAQGKTILASNWVETSGLPTAWLNLEPEHGAIDNLVYGLAQALTKLTGMDANQLVAMTAQSLHPAAGEAGLRHVAGLFMSIMPQGSQLVLDGLDRLPAGAPCFSVLGHLIESALPERRLILLGRQVPPEIEPAFENCTPLVVSNSELACTEEEVGQLLSLAADGAPAQSLVRSVHEITGGWTGAVRLYAEIASRSDQAMDVSLAKLRGELFQHIARDFFAALEPDLKDFLLGCAPFRLFFPRILAELTNRPDAEYLLADLSRRQMFLRPEQMPDGEMVYRPHLLLTRFLAEQHSKTFSSHDRRQYQSRAAKLFAREGLWEEAAVTHLEVGDFKAAGEAIKAAAPGILKAQRISSLEKLLTALPREQVEQDPWLLYFLCQTWRWRDLEAIVSALPRLEEGFKRAGDECGSLRAMALAVDACLLGRPWSYLESQLNKAEELLAKSDPGSYPMEHAALLINYGLIHAIRGYPNKAGRAYEQALALAVRVDDPALQLQVLVMQVDACNWQGEYKKGADICRELDSMQAYGLPAVIPLEVLLPRSYLHIVNGEFDKAKAFLDKWYDGITRQGLVFLLPVYLLYKLIWSFLTGYLDEARECAAKMKALPGTVVPEYISTEVKMITAGGLTRHGDYAGAKELAHEARIELESDQGKALTQWGGNMLTLAILNRQEGKDAAALIKDLLPAQKHLKEIGGQHWQTECELMLALLHRDQGDLDGAEAWLVEAVNRCHSKGYKFMIILRPQELAELTALAVEVQANEEAQFLGQLMVGRGEPGFREHVGKLLEDSNPAVRELAADLKKKNYRKQSPVLHVNTLGGFEVKVDGRILDDTVWSRKQTRLLFLALIALGPDWVKTDRLLEALWPDSGPEAGARTLRVTLHRLRKNLEPKMDSEVGSAYVERQRGALRLNPELCRVDVHEFRKLLEEAAHRGSAEDPKDAIASLEKAIGLYRGAFLSNEPYMEWAEEKRHTLSKDYLYTLMRAAKLEEKQGKIALAMANYQRVIQEDPVNEPAYQNLMRLQSELGLLGEVKRTYQTCRQNLQSHLGAEPGWSTVSVYQQYGNAIE
jgi:LuxR family maltose regulon positive regulatory protein